MIWRPDQIFKKSDREGDVSQGTSPSRFMRGYSGRESLAHLFLRQGTAVSTMLRMVAAAHAGSLRQSAETMWTLFCWEDFAIR